MLHPKPDRENAHKVLVSYQDSFAAELMGEPHLSFFPLVQFFSNVYKL